MKTLFGLSKKPTLDLLNGLFGEHFEPENTEITPKHTEFISADMSVVLADWLVFVKEGTEDKEYHVEFQMSTSSTMIIRMFEYGFHSARTTKQTMEDQQIVLRYPQQLVLYLERDDSIGESISCVVMFPPYSADSRFEYRVPVKKFWQINTEELKEKLYALIPFNAFSSRKRILEIDSDSSLSSNEKKQMIHAELSQVKEMIRSSQEYILEIYKNGKITEDDLNKMSTVMVNLSHHLYEKFFDHYQTFYQEVEKMVKSIIDEKDLQAMKENRLFWTKKGVVEGKIEGLIDILHARGLSDEWVIKRIKRETNAEKLSQWLVLAATVGSVKELQEALEHSN